MFNKVLTTISIFASMASMCEADGLYDPTEAEMATIEATALSMMPGHDGAKVAGLIVGSQTDAVSGEKINWACGTLHDPESSGDGSVDSMFSGYLVQDTGEFVFAGSSDEGKVDYTTFLIACSQQVLDPPK